MLATSNIQKNSVNLVKPMKLIDPEKLDWSDEESDYLVKLPVIPINKKLNKSNFKKSLKLGIKSVNNKHKIINEETQIDPNQKMLYKSSKYVDGKIKIRENNDLPWKKLPPVADKPKFIQPMPRVPYHVEKQLGNHLLTLLWQQFLFYNVDISGLIQIDHITLINDNLIKFGYYLNFHKLKLVDTETNDYISFQQVVEIVCDVTKDSTTSGTFIPPLPPCCINRCCKVHLKMPLNGYKEDSERSALTSKQYKQLYIAYNQHSLECNGNIRIKNLPWLLDISRISYNLSSIDSKFWELRGDMMIESFQDILEMTELIRVSTVDDQSPNNPYWLPTWLKNEFSSSEILLYQHHFNLIDTSKTNTINSSELITLVNYIGGSMTIPEAQRLINEFNDSNDNVLHFKEFCTLLFKLQRNTIILMDETLLKTMKGFKSQIKIFDDIEELLQYPLDNVELFRYGGTTPIKLELKLYGPENTPYYGGEFRMELTFKDGYPYRRPSLVFLTRVSKIITSHHFNDHYFVV